MCEDGQQHQECSDDVGDALQQVSRWLVVRAAPDQLATWGGKRGSAGTLTVHVLHHVLMKHYVCPGMGGQPVPGGDLRTCMTDVTGGTCMLTVLLMRWGVHMLTVSVQFHI